MGDLSKVYIGNLGAYLKGDATLYIDSVDAFNTNLVDSLDTHLKYIKYKEIVCITYGLIVGITLDEDAMEISFNNSMDNAINFIETFEKVNLPKKIKSVVCINRDDIGNGNCNYLSECSLVWVFEDGTLQLDNLDDIVSVDLLHSIPSVNSVYSIEYEDYCIILCLLDDGTIKCISNEWLNNMDEVQFDTQVAFSNVKQIRVVAGSVFIEYLDFKIRVYNIELTEDITRALEISNRIPNDLLKIIPINISNVLIRTNLIRILMFYDSFVYYFEDGTLLYRDIEIKCSIVFNFYGNILYKTNNIWNVLSCNIQVTHSDSLIYDKIAYDTTSEYIFVGHCGEVYEYNSDNKTLSLDNVPHIYMPTYFNGI